MFPEFLFQSSVLHQPHAMRHTSLSAGFLLLLSDAPVPDNMPFPGYHPYIDFSQTSALPLLVTYVLRLQSMSDNLPVKACILLLCDTHLPVNSCDCRFEWTHPVSWILPDISDSGTSACPDILLDRISAHRPAFCQTRSDSLRYPYHTVFVETATLLFGQHSSVYGGSLRFVVPACCRKQSVLSLSAPLPEAGTEWFLAPAAPWTKMEYILLIWLSAMRYWRWILPPDAVPTNFLSLSAWNTSAIIRRLPDKHRSSQSPPLHHTRQSVLPAEYPAFRGIGGSALPGLPNLARETAPGRSSPLPDALFFDIQLYKT